MAAVATAQQQQRGGAAGYPVAAGDGAWQREWAKTTTGDQPHAVRGAVKRPCMAVLLRTWF